MDLESSTGLGSFHYTLSTPTDANAEATVEGTPTLVLVHPIVLASEIFHRKSNALVNMFSSNKEMLAAIYADPRLRRFNLLTMDLRGHGLTSAGADDTYGPETAARDVLNLMVSAAVPASFYSCFKCLFAQDALKVRAAHVMGLSYGSCVALQMTISAPERVLSLFILSPLPLTEVRCRYPAQYNIVVTRKKATGDHSGPK
jgi:pimeloyl-ACP methyl ester carboxylesterase